MNGRGRIAWWLSVALVFSGACGGGGAHREGSLPLPPGNGGNGEGAGNGGHGGNGRTGGTRGPRPLPPTFVSLEIDRFPRPADEACRDNTRIVEVTRGESISAAVEAAEPGTTVLVEPGTYVERPDEHTDVALRWDANDVCLRAAGGGTVVLESSGPDQPRGMQPRGDDVVIEGFTLRGFATAIGFGGDAGDTQSRVTIERVRIERMRGDFLDGISAQGNNREVSGTPPSLAGLLLLDVVVEGADLGVSCNFGPCTHWWLENTTVSGRRSGLGGSGADAFAIEEGRQIVMVDSTFTHATADGIDTKAEDVVVYGCRVLDVERNGIKNWKGVDVIDTIVDGTGADASLVGESPARYRYLHVLVAHHGRPGDSQYVGTWGYDTRQPLQVEIVNSIFYENATGGLYVPTGSRLSFRNNVFSSGQGVLVDLGGSRRLAMSQLAQFESEGNGSGNRIADPAFTDARARDFSTAPGSPVRDRAERIEGLIREQRGEGPDIGPIESP